MDKEAAASTDARGSHLHPKSAIENRKSSGSPPYEGGVAAFWLTGWFSRRTCVAFEIYAASADARGGSTTGFFLQSKIRNPKSQIDMSRSDNLTVAVGFQPTVRFQGHHVASATAASSFPPTKRIRQIGVKKHFTAPTRSGRQSLAHGTIREADDSIKPRS